MLRPTVPVLALAALTPAAAAAQSPLSLLDFLTPDRIVLGFAQTGIMALRTQLDLVYGDMAVDVGAGRVTLTDVTMWPLPDWDTAGDCRIAADRVTLRTTPFDTPETLLVKMQVAGLSAPAACIPPDLREPLAMAGLADLSVPRLTFDAEYDVPTAGARVEVFATVDDAVAATLVADFSYLWFDGRDDMENPEPVIFLNAASLGLENLGLWEAVQPALPPALSDPAGSALMIEGMLGQALGGMNREAAGADATGDPSALGDGQRAFIASAVGVWPAFLAAPGTLVLETTASGDVFLDPDLLEGDPRAVFDTLRPAVALRPAAAAGVLPLELVERALEPEAELTDDERRTAGLAFATGSGAPPNLERAVALLRPLADAGDGEAALALSEAVEGRAPRNAYLWALQAGAAGAPGATARLDRMERDIGLALALELQKEAAGDTQHDIAALGTLARIREQAARRFTGRGMPRHYGFAAMWATIGAAAGDAESADILSDIEDRIARGGEEAARAWVPFRAEADALAMRAWVSQDLPARFGP